MPALPAGAVSRCAPARSELWRDIRRAGHGHAETRRARREPDGCSRQGAKKSPRPGRRHGLAILCASAPRRANLVDVCSRRGAVARRSGPRIRLPSCCLLVRLGVKTIPPVEPGFPHAKGGQEKPSAPRRRSGRSFDRIDGIPPIDHPQAICENRRNLWTALPASIHRLNGFSQINLPTDPDRTGVRNRTNPTKCSVSPRNAFVRFANLRASAPLRANLVELFSRRGAETRRSRPRT
jgi:hypothetical protein